jgi:hypothetical protein
MTKLTFRMSQVSFDETITLLEFMQAKTVDDPAMMRRIRPILARGLGITEEELGAMTWEELSAVWAQIPAAQEAEQNDAVHPQSARPSASGPAA